MPTDREFRYVMCGLAFLFSVIFFYLLFGGTTLSYLIRMTENRGILAALALAFSSPVIGIVLSSLIFTLLQFIWGYELFYLAPESVRARPIVNYFLDPNPNTGIFNKNDFSENFPDKWKKKDKNKFFTYYQILVREYLKDEKIKYLERRWAVYWTHTNILFSIGVGLVMAFFISGPYNLEYRSPKNYEWGILFILVVYIVAAIYQRREARRFGMEYEQLVILEGLNSCSKCNDGIS